MSNVPKVLVVDDEADSRDIVATRLRRDGYEVFEAASGDAALVMLAASEAMDLLILDIHMPGRSGISVLRELRRQHATIPALFITGSPEPGLMTTAVALDAGVLLKPIALDRLSDAALRSIVRA